MPPFLFAGIQSGGINPPLHPCGENLSRNSTLCPPSHFHSLS
jgi:hypothetical protein